MATTKKVEHTTLLRPLVSSTLAIVLCAVTLSVHGQSQGDPLLRGFQNPPDSAKPRVWWHWMNGNVSKEGIKADLEWMKRVGFLSPEWKDVEVSSRRLIGSSTVARWCRCV